MRHTTLIPFCLAVVSCATTAPPTVGSSTGAAGAVTAPSKAAPSAASARASGYTVVTQNGETRYCRKNLETGSHVKQKVACLTAAELTELQDETKRSMQNLSRPPLPPPGT